MFKWIGKFFSPPPPPSPAKCVATGEFLTSIIDDSHQKTGIVHTHILEFWANEEGRRWTKYTTSNKDSAESNGSMTKASAHWRIHGVLPRHAVRTDQPKPTAKLIVLDGGNIKGV